MVFPVSAAMLRPVHDDLPHGSHRAGDKTGRKIKPPSPNRYTFMRSSLDYDKDVERVAGRD